MFRRHMKRVARNMDAVEYRRTSIWRMECIGNKERKYNDGLYWCNGYIEQSYLGEPYAAADWRVRPFRPPDLL